MAGAGCGAIPPGSWIGRIRLPGRRCDPRFAQGLGPRRPAARASADECIRPRVLAAWGRNGAIVLTVTVAAGIVPGLMHSANSRAGVRARLRVLTACAVIGSPVTMGRVTRGLRVAQVGRAHANGVPNV